eukprot:gene6198-263_t
MDGEGWCLKQHRWSTLQGGRKRRQRSRGEEPSSQAPTPAALAAQAQTQAQAQAQAAAAEQERRDATAATAAAAAVVVVVVVCFPREEFQGKVDVAQDAPPRAHSAKRQFATSRRRANRNMQTHLCTTTQPHN